MKCAGCSRELVVGDRYIADTSSGFLKVNAEPDVDNLFSLIFGASDGRIHVCEDCTEPGGDYLFETVHGDAGEASA